MSHRLTPAHSTPTQADGTHGWAYGRLWSMARAVCCEVSSFRPDVVLGLAHGGWLPLRVGMALWPEIHAEPFPPVVRTNIGREKQRRFDDECERLEIDLAYPKTDDGIDTGLFQALFSDGPVITHFLVWLREQQHWQAELRDQVSSVLGAVAPPRRALIVDEGESVAGTRILALGLLSGTFPGMEGRFLSGGDWRGDLPKLWLRTFHPETLAALQAEQRRPHGALELPCLSHLFWMAPGTEDVDDDCSLAWRQLTQENGYVQPLLRYLPF